MEDNKAYSLDELKAEWKKRDVWLAEHYILAFFISVYEFTIYRIPALFQDTRLSIKWAYQRVVRGYDDRMVWSFYSEHSKMVKAVLTQLRNNHVGSPIDDDTDYNTNVDIHKKWEDKLDDMIAAFDAIEKMEDLDFVDLLYTKKLKELNKTWEKGMELFTKNYRSLWD